MSLPAQTYVDHGFLTRDEFNRPALFPIFDEDADGKVTRAEGVTGLIKLNKKSDDLKRGRKALQGLLDSFR